jgi:hypothetical protein
MASTWKMLHDQSANMKKANPKEQEKLDRICNYVNIVRSALTHTNPSHANKL